MCSLPPTIDLIGKVAANMLPLRAAECLLSEGRIPSEVLVTSPSEISFWIVLDTAEGESDVVDAISTPVLVLLATVENILMSFSVKANILCLLSIHLYID